jgi:serine protease DegQ
MRRLWLLFAQTVTVCLGILFIVSTLRPDWLGRGTPLAPVTAPSVALSSNGGVVSYANAVARAVPAVVNVYTSKKVVEPVFPFPNDPELSKLFGSLPGLSRSRRTTALGSGVIVRADGYVLTNYHVVEAADEIEVALADGRQARAKVVGSDPETDLAVLHIDLPNLHSIEFTDSTHLRVGDVVLAIGNPFGVGQTTTMGIISALGRNRLGINMYENFIQTDAAINPGNSGGALIDTAGRLIGINTAIYSETGGSLGIGFAIPATAAQNILQQIIDQGFVTRGWVGLEPQDITPDLAHAFNLSGVKGVIVAGLVRGGPAAQAGLKVGDIIQSVNDATVVDTTDFLSSVAQIKPGSMATVKILRAGRPVTITVKVAQRPHKR